MPIYRDSVGRPNSKAVISVFGSFYGQPGTGGRLVLSTVSDAPKREWPYISSDVSNIIAEMEEEGWECVVTKDGYGAPRIHCIHIETQAVITAASQESDVKFASAERGFIRFGDLPANGRSINHRDKTPEAGVSVFEAEFVGTDYRVLVDSVLEVSYLLVRDRPAYRVYGDVVGIGADGEPLLRVTKTVRL